MDGGGTWRHKPWSQFGRWLGLLAFVPLGMTLLILPSVSYVSVPNETCRTVVTGWPLPWRSPEYGVSMAETVYFLPLLASIAAAFIVAGGLVVLWRRQRLIRIAWLDGLLLVACWLPGLFFALMLFITLSQATDHIGWYRGDEFNAVEKVDFSFGYRHEGERMGC